MDFDVTLKGAICGYHGLCSDVVIPEGFTHFQNDYSSYPFKDTVITSLYLPKSFMGLTYNLMFPDSSRPVVVKKADGTMSVIPAREHYKSRDQYVDCADSLRFIQFKGLERYEVHEENPVYSAYKGLLYSKSYTQLLLCPAHASGVVELHENTQLIHFSAFIDCTELSRLILPQGIKIFNDARGRYFVDKTPDNFAIVGTNVRELDSFGSNASCVKNSALHNAILVFPKCPLSSVYAFYKVRMAMGYCLCPELYDESVADEYQRFLIKEKGEILSIACKINAKEVIDYYNKLDEHEDGNSSVKSAKKPKKKVLPARKAVVALEEAICTGSVDDVADVLATQRSFTFTARALGLACRYGGLDKVKLMVEAGHTFYYGDIENCNHSYFGNYTINSGIGKGTLADYLLLIVIDHFRKIFVGDGKLLPINKEGDVVNAKLLSQAARVEIIEYLIDKNLIASDRLDDLYFYAILFGSNEIAKGVQKLGGSLKPYAKILSGSSSGPIRRELVKIALTENPKAAIVMAKAAKKEKLFFKISVNTDISKLYTDLPLLAQILNHLQFTSNFIDTITEQVIQSNQQDILEVILESGQIKSLKQIDQYINIASSLDASESTVRLLDYKNQNFAHALANSKSKNTSALSL